MSEECSTFFTLFYSIPKNDFSGSLRLFGGNPIKDMRIPVCYLLDYRYLCGVIQGRYGSLYFFNFRYMYKPTK